MTREIKKRRKRTPEEKKVEAIKLFAENLSIREIARRLHMDRHALSQLAESVGYRSGSTNKATRLAEPGEPTCTYCKGLIGRNRKSHRYVEEYRFCSTACWAEFNKQKRGEDKCRECGITRKETPRQVFQKGYCEYCHDLLKKFGFDEELVRTYLTNRELREEIKKEMVWRTK